MTEYSLDPAFVRLDYVSVWGPHVHLIPTKEWLPTSISGTMGSYVDWTSTPVDAEAMIDDLVAAFAPIHKDNTNYTLATIYTKDGVDAPAIPVATKALSVAGSSALTTHAKAIQATFNMRTLGVQPFKLVFLDVPHSGGDFDKETPFTFSAAEIAIFAEVMNPARAWAGRDNTQGAAAISVTWNINQSLRKRYGMA